MVGLRVFKGSRLFQRDQERKRSKKEAEKKTSTTSNPTPLMQSMVSLGSGISPSLRKLRSKKKT